MNSRGRGTDYKPTNTDYKLGGVRQNIVRRGNNKQKGQKEN